MSMADTRDRLAEELTGPMDALGLDLEAVDLTSAGKPSKRLTRATSWARSAWCRTCSPRRP